MIKKHLLTGAVTCATAITLPSALFADEKPVSLMTAVSTTTLSGYVDASAQWNFGTGNANLPPYSFGGTSKADGFNLNVVDLQLEKPVESADVWGAGYKVELLAGPDANTFATQSSGNASDFAVKQAYVALHAPVGNGIDFKLGVWDTIIGYESFNTPNDPNFTRSYGYTMEPTTHTGLLGTYNVLDSLSVSVGVANTFGPMINERAPAESYKTYMGGFTFTAPTNSGFLSGSTISAAVINGFNSFTLGNETSYYVGGTVNTPVSGLKAGAAFDYMDVHGVSGETYAIGGYVSFQATEKLSFNGRAEYVRDRGDQKFFSPAPERFGELTATAQYDLWKNVMTRVELRWDHSFSGGAWGDSENLKNEVMLAANVIYKF